MADQKTKPTEKSVTKFLDTLEDEQKRLDSLVLIKMMQEITGEKPVLWGPNIIGFGQYHYKYPSGHEGYSCVAGFSPRKPSLSIYLMIDREANADLYAKLGKYKSAVACLYVKRLADVDLEVLKKLIERSVEFVKRKYS